MKLELTSAERGTLRSRAHDLRPVVMIGDAGLLPAVMREIDRSLASHELIKVRALSAEHEMRAGWLAQICDELGAAPVQHIGKTLVVYRPKKEDADSGQARKAKPRRVPPRRTKRSFQR